MRRIIYADHAATTQLDKDAFEEMRPFLLNEYGNASQHYSISRTPKKALIEARKIIAECIGASAEEIYFTSGGSESDTWAIKGTASKKRECCVVTSRIEHHAILNACGALQKEGVTVHYLPVSEQGVVELDRLKKIDENIGLVSVMMANNEIGSIQPIKDLAQLAHARGALIHTDAVQAVGHIPVNVEELGVDMLSASAHKFNGPKGVGFLYIKKGIEIDSLINGGSQEFGMRAGTENIAGIVAMATALKNNCEEMKSNIERLCVLERIVIDGLAYGNVEFVRNGAEKGLPGIISLSFKGKDGEAILHRMDLLGICVSTGSACDSRDTRISHVLKAISLPEEWARGTIRISFGRDNSADDAKIIVDNLIKIVGPINL